MGIKKLLGRILRKTGLIKMSPPAYLAFLKENYIKIGQHCELDGSNIIIVEKKAGTTYIEIGDNCCIRGTIMLYKATSKVIIGNNVYIGPGTILECVEEIKIGDDVLVSMNCNIIDTDSHSLHSGERKNDTVDWQKGLMYKDWNLVISQKVAIESKSWIGLRSIVLKGVTLSEGTIVAAGSVVTKSTEPFSLIGGNPAKFIKATD